MGSGEWTPMGSGDWTPLGSRRARAWPSPPRGSGLIAGYAGLLALWIVAKPGNPTVFALLRDLFLFCGMVGAAVACWGWPRPRQLAGAAQPAVSRRQIRASRLLAWGILCNVGGSVLWFAHAQLAGQPPRFPWWTDALYLSAYPFLFLSVLVLPAETHSLAIRTRVVLDSLMIITAVAMGGWFLALGPVILRGHAAPLAAVVGAAYPLCDLVLLCAAILLAARGGTAPFPAVRLLAVGLGLIAVCDSIFDYQMLHGTYVSAGLVNVGWTAGYMMLGLVGASLRKTPPDPVPEHGAAPATPRAWQAMVPYALLPAVGALLVYAARTHGTDRLATGVYAGGVVLFGLMLARHILTLLDNARLYGHLAAAYAAQGQHLAQRQGELDWLRMISRRINEVRVLDDVLDVVYDGVRTGLGYDRLGIQLIDHERHVYEERRGTDIHGRKIRPPDRVFSLGENSVIWRFPDVAALLGGADFFYSPDMTAESPPEQHALLDGAPTHFLAVPLRAGAIVTGIIEVDNLRSGRPITPADAGPLLALASQVGTAIENARLLEREHAERAATEAARQRVTVLARASELLASSLDHSTTLQSVAQLMLTHLADACMVDIIEEDGSFSQAAVACRDPAQEERLRAVRLRTPPDPGGTHALTTVLRSGRPIVMPVVTEAWLQAHTRGAEHLALLRDIGIRAYMCVPLCAHGRTLGALTFISTDPERRYGPDDIVLAEDLARRAALAIDNANLYRQAQEAVRVRDHFLLTASHDLRTPLTSIMGRAELIQMRLGGSALLNSDEGPTNAWVSDQVSALREAAWRMACTVEEITDAAHLQMGRRLELQLSILDVSALVRGVVQSLQAGRYRGTAPISLEAPESVLVRGDRARLERVMENVIGNAVKYSPERTPVHIGVDTAGDAVAITVRDSGVGIPAEELPHIFTHFYRATTAIGIRGTGLGLAGAKTIVEQHGGQITLTSAAGQGTTVVVRLPRSLSDGVTTAGEHGPRSLEDIVATADEPSFDVLSN